MKRSLYIPTLFSALLAIVGYVYYESELDEIRRSSINTVNVRAGLFEQYFKLISAHNTGLKNTMIHSYHFAEEGKINLPQWINAIEYFPEYDIYALSAFDHPEKASKLKGTLTMMEPFNPTNEKQRYEMTAALSLNEQISTLVRELGVAVWSYYISANKYLFLSPELPVREFQLSEADYRRPFWVQAQPKVNPYGRQFVSDLYEDSGGQGLMVTITDPVWIHDEFFGVVAIDIGIDSLLDLLQVSNSVGQSYLVDENKKIVSSLTEFEVNETINFPAPSDGMNWVEDKDGFYLWRSVVPNELDLVHFVSREQLRDKGIKHSMTVWMLLLIGMVLSFSAYFLYVAFRRNQRLMRIDPLTKIQNRRGFFDELDNVYPSYVNSKSDVGLLILDIDNFKPVNDTYGHLVGDDVLISIVKRISSVIPRISSVCRWGGEEFMVFHPSCSPEELEQLAEEIRHQIKATPHSDLSLPVTVSIGGYFGQTKSNFNTMVRHADRALYTSKHQGKDQVTVHYEPSED
ncbi:sensor domain-containing diguanylate cyclase [Vibrio nigripulchritudo]|uniref:sensor domain-containing diguanylate cyclase n=1 Tax=Vibrio nigripulchritudo TaxID=28173 RepID=UPI0005F9EFF8|nr:sensor domain-containing diguanylate cyclase [Vibrio nigripulchritudo]KJY78769.1 hypothetical protein TW74_12090 [Vibrio nigripulchritudo]